MTEKIEDLVSVLFLPLVRRRFIPSVSLELTPSCSTLLFRSSSAFGVRIALTTSYRGLKTDLGLLANGSIWGWTICVIVVAFFAKFIR